jgi:fluoroacetyl-CoA thioesterase
MKPGFAPGVTGEARFVVDESMLAAFEGQVVHRVLGTAPLVGWLELAGRRVILPWLEEHEEGVGHAISIVHRAPAPSGTNVTARAVLTEYAGNRVICRVEAHTDDGRLIADGAFTQVILPKATIRALFAPQPDQRKDEWSG